MPHDETLCRIVDFIRSIGIDVNEGAMTRETLVPGIDVVCGTLLIDEAMMCKPADLLHEAAHIALTLASYRDALDGTADTSAAEEISAIGWTWAASRHLDIDPAEVFHVDVISGNGPTLLENFLEGRYLGVPMLQRWGMAIEPKNASATGLDPYPHMLRWLRS
ncbi:MAG TPA: hypothetical protein VGQ46_01245 [Thermoanaerobaculia bacterium]|jgi:hypothetical protein|nr:hypothetical protein [Thermoanaerobaculia bacterium]